jgi:hypothetical protein
MYWKFMLVIMAVGATTWGVSEVRAANSADKLGEANTAVVERVADEVVNEHYKVGGWGKRTCEVFRQQPKLLRENLAGENPAVVVNHEDVERVWGNRLEDAYREHPSHESRTRLGEHPSWKQVAFRCDPQRTQSPTKAMGWDKDPDRLKQPELNIPTIAKQLAGQATGR